MGTRSGQAGGRCPQLACLPCWCFLLHCLAWLRPTAPPIAMRQMVIASIISVFVCRRALLTRERPSRAGRGQTAAFRCARRTAAATVPAKKALASAPKDTKVPIAAFLGVLRAVPVTANVLRTHANAPMVSLVWPVTQRAAPMTAVVMASATTVPACATPTLGERTVVMVALVAAATMALARLMKLLARRRANVHPTLVVLIALQQPALPTAATTANVPTARAFVLLATLATIVAKRITPAALPNAMRRQATANVTSLLASAFAALAMVVLHVINLAAKTVAVDVASAKSKLATPRTSSACAPRAGLATTAPLQPAQMTAWHLPTRVLAKLSMVPKSACVQLGFTVLTVL